MAGEAMPPVEAFESTIGRILERAGYWVKHSYKVRLDGPEKLRIGKPNCPAWDLDIVAYSGAKNRILVVECKGYLGSTGVRFESIARADSRWSKNFKLFNDERLRDVVFQKLRKQLLKEGCCAEAPSIQLCLAAGNISKNDRSRLGDLFSKRGWVLFDGDWILEKLEAMNASKSYENDVATIVIKLLARNAEAAGQHARPGAAKRSAITVGAEGRS